jgi:hypothetical protein
MGLSMARRRQAMTHRTTACSLGIRMRPSRKERVR